MGTSYSRNQSTLTIRNNGSSTPAKVIHAIDGRLQEFRQPITAGDVISDHNPEKFFLCNAENMYVNCHVPHVPDDEELEMGQIYFVMPMSRSCRPVSLEEMCLLAIKASSVIEGSSEMKRMKMMMGRMRSVSGRRKRNGDAGRSQKVDFQLALKKL